MRCYVCKEHLTHASKADAVARSQEYSNSSKSGSVYQAYRFSACLCRQRFIDHALPSASIARHTQCSARACSEESFFGWPVLPRYWIIKSVCIGIRWVRAGKKGDRYAFSLPQRDMKRMRKREGGRGKAWKRGFCGPPSFPHSTLFLSPSLYPSLHLAFSYFRIKTIGVVQ